MRKIILVLLLIMISFPVLAVTYKADTSGTIALQGGYGDVVSVSVETLKAQANEYMAGMPFSITDRSVEPSSSGRAIAEWSVIANKAFNIKINAQPLYSVSTPSNQYNYILIFQYDLGYVAFGEEVKVSGDIEVSSEDYKDIIEDQTPISFLHGETYDSDHFIGSVDGMIFFRFIEGTTFTNAIPGEYAAKVEILIETEG